MVKVAQCGGYELIEDGTRLLFVHRGTDAYVIAIFVAGLVALITGVNGIVQIALAASGQGHPVLAAILALVAAGALALVVVLVRAKRARATQALEARHVTLVIDRDRGALTDAEGRPFAPLQGAVFRAVFQLGSSSHALELGYAGGARVVARGSPFTGSIADFKEALRQRGFSVS